MNGNTYPVLVLTTTASITDGTSSAPNDVYSFASITSGSSITSQASSSASVISTSSACITGASSVSTVPTSSASVTSANSETSQASSSDSVTSTSSVSTAPTSSAFTASAGSITSQESRSASVTSTCSVCSVPTRSGSISTVLNSLAFVSSAFSQSVVSSAPIQVPVPASLSYTHTVANTLEQITTDANNELIMQSQSASSTATDDNSELAVNPRVYKYADSFIFARVR